MAAPHRPRHLRHRVEKATHDGVPFRYLATNQHPDHDTIANFRRRLLEELAKLFVQALKSAPQSGVGGAGQCSD
ncbi:MAG: transposase [Bryobacterales bacterium]|nr:transposase [Bryobacterales bacterium]